MHRSLALVSTLTVLALAYTAAGQCSSWTPLTNISHDDGHYAVDGNLVIDSSGYIHIVYQSFLDTWGQAYYTTNQGGSWSTPASLGSLGGKGSAPKIIMTPDNQLHAFYGKNRIYWRTKPAVGGSWSGAVQIDAELNAGDSGSFIEAITVDSSGGIYIIFGHLFDEAAPVRNGIYGKYKPLGGAWAALEVVYGNSDDGHWPLGTDIAARATTLWVAIQVDGNVYFKKKASTGAWPSGRGTQLVGGAGALKFVFSPVSAEISALYQQDLGCTDACEDDPWYEVLVKYSYDDGATWSAPYDISNLTDDIDRTPSGVYDANGNLHVVWEGFCCDHRLRMRYRGRFNGVWEPTITRITSHAGGHMPNSLQCRGTALHMVFSDGDTDVGLYDVEYTWTDPSQPRIALAPLSCSHSILVGGSVADDLLTIGNECVGTFNYTVTSDQSWLVPMPASGSVTTETDVIALTYPTASQLRVGTYSAAVTVSGNASNSPQTLPVQLIIRTVQPDLDGDGDVDQGDFGLFQTCLSGSLVSQDLPACQPMKLDSDDDVDADDFAILAGCFSGSGTRADTGCAALYP